MDQDEKILMIMISVILLTLFVSSESALAWHGHYRGHSGFFFAPPPIWTAPPPVYYRGYYAAPNYYPPDYCEPYRVWVPGHWEDRWIPPGWQRVWIPGYWQYQQ